MIKDSLSQAHVSLVDVSELTDISRVTLENYIYVYDIGLRQKVTNKAVLSFFDFLGYSKNLTKRKVLAYLLDHFGGISGEETGLVISKIKNMDKEKKEKTLGAIQKIVNGGLAEPEAKEDEATAYKIWDALYGPYDLVLDFAGRPMLRSAYGKENAIYSFDDDQADNFNLDGEGEYYVGWNLHHMMPKAKGGPNAMANLIPANIKTNKLAGDKTSYTIDGRQFEVRRTRGKKNPQYGIYDKDTGDFLIGFTPLKEK
jgi:hypothetical protein